MEIIKEIRLSKGMTARELGEKSNTTERYIYMIENGQCNPSLKKLKAIAKALGKDVKDLL